MADRSFPCTPFTHTYSIVAHDPQTGEIGVAAGSHWIACGSSCPWAEAGVAAIAVQGIINPSYGPRAVELLKQGKPVQAVIESLLNADEGRDFRQLAIIDCHGEIAAWTGEKCIPTATHIIGKNFSVQGNLLLNDRVCPEMAEAFQQTKGDLIDRLISALEAAQKAGGDSRGRQSACIKVVTKEKTGNPSEGRKIDLRVDDHADPLKELKRLVAFDRACKRIVAGDTALEQGDIEEALRQYQGASEMFPDYAEFTFWHTVTLANTGRINEALALFAPLFQREPNWRLIAENIAKVGFLAVNDDDLASILSLP